MNLLSRLVVGATGLVVVGGCAIVAQNDAKLPGYSVLPVAGAAPADGQYQLGKYYLGEQRFILAVEAFSRALSYDPGHVEALNARATALVQLGDAGAAIADLQRAATLAPRSVHVFNNLGYAKFLSGDFDGAAAALRTAFRLDPKNARVRANWTALAAKLPSGSELAVMPEVEGMTESAKAEVPALTEPVKVDPARVQSITMISVGARPTVLPATSPSSAAASVVNVTYGQSGAVATNPGSMPSTSIVNIPMAGTLAQSPATDSIGAVPAASASQSSSDVGASATAKTSPGAASVRLDAKVEIANGNGMRGAAKDFGRSLEARGARVVNLVNMPSFGVRSSTIYFRNGHVKEAMALRQSLAPKPAVMPSDSMHRLANIKVVLGRDVGRAPKVVASAPDDSDSGSGRIEKLASAQ